jgi:hypothetical protein
VSREQPKDGEVQFKCLRLFIKYDKADLVLKAGLNLVENCSNYLKIGRALSMIKTYAQTAKFTNKEDWAKFETKVKQLGIDALSQNCML